MKKKNIIAGFFVAIVSVVSLCSFTTHSDEHVEAAAETHTHVDAQGDICRGTVGCKCYGFLPAGPEHYKQFYCRRCGHQKSYHR